MPVIERRLFTVTEIAALAADSENRIQEFIRDDRIAYVIFPDGILIPLGAFQIVMPELYDLTEGLDA